MQAMQAHLARSLGTTRERFGVDQKKEGRASQEKPPLLIYSPKVLIQITSVPDRVSQGPAVSQLIEIRTGSSFICLASSISKTPTRKSLNTTERVHSNSGSHEFKEPSINKQQKLISKNRKNGDMFLRKIEGRRR